MTAYTAADWDGFGTTVATAAATLTGLLFVAISINLKKILDYTPLPGRAAVTLILFAVPLVFTLLLVVPGQSRVALAWELMATAVTIWSLAQVVDHRAGRSEYEPAWSWLLTRAVPMSSGCACVLVAGVTLLTQAGGGLYWLVPATVLLIAAGLINTWVLLIEIMR